MSAIREKGLYRVKCCNMHAWEICYWDGKIFRNVDSTGIRQEHEFDEINENRIPEMENKNENVGTRKFRWASYDVLISVDFKYPNIPAEIIDQTFNDILGNQGVFIQGPVSTQS